MPRSHQSQIHIDLIPSNMIIKIDLINNNVESLQIDKIPCNFSNSPDYDIVNGIGPSKNIIVVLTKFETVINKKGGFNRGALIINPLSILVDTEYLNQHISSPYYYLDFIYEFSKSRCPMTLIEIQSYIKLSNRSSKIDTLLS